MDDLEALNKSIQTLAKKIVSLIQENWTEIHGEFGYTYGEGVEGTSSKVLYKNQQGESKNPLNISLMREVKPLS